MEKNPFHSGELKVQALAGETQIASRNGRLIADRIPNGALKFVDKQPFVLAASLDEERSIWVSLLAGQPGFVQAETPEVVQLDTTHLVSADNDIFWTNVGNHPGVGLLFIELATRRRLKVNGPVTVAPDGTGLQVNVQECFPLCPRYIQRREVAVTTATRQTNAAAETGLHFTPALQEWISGADTLFVGSGHDDYHLDVGHRGGNPGFVQILDENTLLIPDYNGNSMFNSLGNFSVNPRAGLLFVNFETGEALQLTGHAELHFTEPDADDATGGTGRYWQFHLHSSRRQASLTGLNWTFLDYSPFNV
ncbi:hypothetical protein GCM10010967_48850 [Dyadobacter beijingensis]|uniref:Pyridoxamine 5'-phosphate oxidase N-terminal domain-containing protein n=1 Tax=Dyadobacter beijingensis TaxID=365489 RepID=A0ABQ2IGJ6_9BACT|nr:pyridoxamine 5'-phosphate oxidase family protein [Dyadobacter beijingensis]GGN07487.1 hypothetical protein GCM10010967_48850 [Dyadobacter beijingensis]